MTPWEVSPWELTPLGTDSMRPDARGTCRTWELSSMGTVARKNCRPWELSHAGTVVRGYCRPWELTLWELTLVGTANLSHSYSADEIIRENKDRGTLK